MGVEKFALLERTPLCSLIDGIRVGVRLMSISEHRDAGREPVCEEMAKDSKKRFWRELEEVVDSSPSKLFVFPNGSGIRESPEKV